MQLTAQSRTTVGKQVKSLRAKGFIPAELYGRGVRNLHLVVPVKEFNNVFRSAGESTLITLAVEGSSQPFNVLIHDLQHDAMTGATLHVDFYAVRMDEKITIAVPLEFIHEAPAVKEKQGVLIKAMHEIKVEALPGDLPHSIVVDLASLTDIDASVYVRNLSVPKNVKVLVDAETVVATVTAQAAEEEVVAPLTVQDVKVESEEKKKEAAVAAEASPEKK